MLVPVAIVKREIMVPVANVGTRNNGSPTLRFEDDTFVSLPTVYFLLPTSDSLSASNRTQLVRSRSDGQSSGGHRRLRNPSCSSGA